MEILVNKKQEILIPDNFNFKVSNKPNHLTFLENQVIDGPVKVIIKDYNEDKFIIDIKENTQINLFLEYLVSDKKEFNPVLEINLGKNAHVKYFFMCETSSEKLELKHIINQDNDSNLLQIGTFVNNNININWEVNLNGRGASINIQNLLLSSKNESQSISCHLTHHAPNTNADMNLIGAASDQGVVKLNGLATINQGMKGSNAFQTLKGIILSEKAQIDVNPILIIDEFDISAGHAATVGKVDEEQLYYLQSRGLDKISATKLIVKGFLTPVIALIDDEVIQEHLIELVDQKL